MKFFNLELFIIIAHLYFIKIINQSKINIKSYNNYINLKDSNQNVSSNNMNNKYENLSQDQMLDFLLEHTYDKNLNQTSNENENNNKDNNPIDILDDTTPYSEEELSMQDSLDGIKSLDSLTSLRKGIDTINRLGKINKIDAHDSKENNNFNDNNDSKTSFINLDLDVVKLQQSILSVAKENMLEMHSKKVFNILNLD